MGLFNRENILLTDRTQSMKRLLYTPPDLQFLACPISDALVSKEYCSALNKRFNIDIY